LIQSDEANSDVSTSAV